MLFKTDNAISYQNQSGMLVSCTALTQTIHFFQNLLVESWIYLDIPVIANFERSTGEFFFAERRRMNIFWLNRYLTASYE